MEGVLIYEDDDNDRTMMIGYDTTKHHVTRLFLIQSLNRFLPALLEIKLLINLDRLTDCLMQSTYIKMRTYLNNIGLRETPCLK